MRVVSVAVTAFLLLALPNVAAQDHDHGSGGAGVILGTGLPDARAVVGVPAHFQYVILNDDGAPQVHRDVHVKVTVNDVLLYATKSGHDYDGTGSLLVTFPVPGAYRIEVAVPSSGSTLEASLDGTVIEMRDAVTATFQDETPESGMVGEALEFTYGVYGTDGALLPHTDVQVDIRRVDDDFPVLGVHTHGHLSEQSFRYAFDTPGSYVVRYLAFQAFPSDDDVIFTPVIETRTLAIRESAGLPAALPGTAAPKAEDSPAPAAKAFVSHLQLDPASGTDHKVGPYGTVRATHVSYDPATHVLLEHVDYTAKLTGPLGVVFESASLHEYDGALEIMVAPRELGSYTWSIKATAETREDARSASFTVEPVVTPQGVGPQFLSAAGLDLMTQGKAGMVQLTASNGAVPFMHSEVAMELQDETGLPLVGHKLHTHMTGGFAFSFTPAMAGPHTLQADLFDIHGSPTPTYYGPSLGEPTRYAFESAAGAPLPAVVAAPEMHAEQESETVPSVALSLVLVALAGLLVLSRRRL